MKYVDPDGEIFVESPSMKKRADPNAERGYVISVSSYREPGLLARRMLPAVDRSRAESGISNDKGDMSLVENFPSADIWLLGNPEKRGPRVDRLTMEIYASAFDGEINENGNRMVVPSEQTYRQVRNRIGAIWGLVAYLTNRGSRFFINTKNGGIPLAENISIGQEWNNLSKEEQDTIANTIKQFAQEDKIKYIE